MVSFGKLFGKKKKEEEAPIEPSKPVEEALIEPSKPVEEKPPDLHWWVLESLNKGPFESIIKITEIPAINDALLDELPKKYPGLTSHEISSYIQKGLNVRCWTCLL